MSRDALFTLFTWVTSLGLYALLTDKPTTHILAAIFLWTMTCEALGFFLGVRE